MILEAYRVIKKKAIKENVKILNGTRGGLLEEFERVDISSYFEQD
jgi:hypothetical protein